MPTWEFACGDTLASDAFNSNTTRFNALAGALRGYISAESDVQTKVFSSYTWANLYFRVTIKTYTGNPTLRSRVNAANGALLVTITGTGVFEDTVNTDSLVNGDLIDFSVTTPNEVGQTMSATVLGSTLENTSTNDTLAVVSGGSGSAPSVNFGLTRFALIGGEIGIGGALATTESDVQYTIRRATTFTNVRVIIRTNTINTGTTVWRFRVNAANVNQLVNIAAGATGAFEDTTNSDPVVAGDEVNQQVVTSGASGAISTQLAQLAHSSTGREVMSASVSPDSWTTDLYFGAEADAAGTATESSSQIAARAAFTAEDLFVNVTAHGASNGVNFYLRQNGANSALTLNVAASSTGLFEDTTNSVSIAATDTYNYLLDHGGGAGSITPTIIGMAQGPTDVIADLPRIGLNILLRM